MAILSREAADVLNYTSTMLKVRVVEPAFRLAMNSNNTSTSTRNTCSEHSSVKTTSTKTTTKPPRKPTLTEVRVLLQLWKRALVWGDAEAVASRYSPTAIMTPLLGNEHAGVVVPLQGRDAIQSYFEQTFLPKHRPKEIKVLKGNVSLLGERIHDNGIYDITTQSGRIMRMKYIFVYARDPTSNGHWRIVHHKSSLIGDIPTIKTPRDNHAKHDRTILQEHEQGSSSQTTACKDDNRATHVRSIGPVSPVEDETEESSSICSEIIPWGSFPYEDERYPMIETADTSTSSMSTLTRLSSVVTTSTISTISTHDSRIEKDVSPKAPKRRLSLSSTSDFVEEYYAPLKGEEEDEEPPRAPEDKSPKIPRRRLSIGHNLVDFVTSHEEPRHEVVRNHHKRTVVPDNTNTTTRTTAPKRRRSEVDRLVGLLTGTESVSQSQLIILSVNNNNNQSNNNDDPASETVVEPVIEYVVPNRRPSEVEHLVGLLTGSKPVSQSDLIFLSVDNNKKENELYASDIDASHRIPQ